jgi:hypothetical protein
VTKKYFEAFKLCDVSPLIFRFFFGQNFKISQQRYVQVVNAQGTIIIFKTFNYFQEKSFFM